MSQKTFRTDCGCEIHIIKWNSKTDMASVKNCPLHKAAGDLLAALKELLPIAVAPIAFVDCKKQVNRASEAIAKAEEAPCSR